MARIPDIIIDKIRDASDIGAIVEKCGISLKKKGANYWGLCPFHDDHKESLCVSPAKQIYKCFSCGCSGNVFSFVMEKENLSYPEAVRWLGNEAKIEVPKEELSAEQKQLNDDRESCRAAIYAAQSLLEGQLLCNEEARQYLLQRDISDESVKLFGIGYAPGQGFMTRTLKEHGFREAFLLMGDICRNDEGRIRDTFMRRITFPYYDRRGQIVGWTGRAIGKDPKVKHGKKCWNLPSARRSTLTIGLCHSTERR